MEREGFSVATYDANLELYYWLFGEDAAATLAELAEGMDDADTRRGLLSILRKRSDFFGDVTALFGASMLLPNELVTTHFKAIKSLEVYLGMVSSICGDFNISPFGFRTTRDMLDANVLSEFAFRPPRLLAEYAIAFCDKKLGKNSDIVGLSCIGQEQLPFTLLFGRLLKERGLRVVVGGTILSRIQQRGLLPSSWLESFFDVIVHNEGERALTQLLGRSVWSPATLRDVNGVTFLKDAACSTTPPAATLRPDEMPLPDFDGLPLQRYFTAEVTLPLLASRGCYWGHCEFCHHGMVYGEKYSAYGVENIIESVKALSQKYGVRFFSFNDEAVPPKLMRALGNSELSDLNCFFQALFKFENYYTRDDFEKLYKVGFRNLYVGLESASERVLALMRKNTKQEVFVRNLTDSAQAGIWTHCFLFFGFPGETEEDAKITYDFVLNNSEIIGSFGAGNFEFEHGAPISRHHDDFSLTLHEPGNQRVDVYYRYSTQEGHISQTRAADLAKQLHAESRTVPHYRSSGWVPREQFLILVSLAGSATLESTGDQLYLANGVMPNARLADFLSLDQVDDATLIVVNRLTRKTIAAKNAAKEAVLGMLAAGWSVEEARLSGSPFAQFFVSRLTNEDEVS